MPDVEVPINWLGFASSFMDPSKDLTGYVTAVVELRSGAVTVASIDASIPDAIKGRIDWRLLASQTDDVGLFDIVILGVRRGGQTTVVLSAGTMKLSVTSPGNRPVVTPTSGFVVMDFPSNTQDFDEANLFSDKIDDREGLLLPNVRIPESLLAPNPPASFTTYNKMDFGFYSGVMATRWAEMRASAHAKTHYIFYKLQLEGRPAMGADAYKSDGTTVYETGWPVNASGARDASNDWLVNPALNPHPVKYYSACTVTAASVVEPKRTCVVWGPNTCPNEAGTPNQYQPRRYHGRWLLRGLGDWMDESCAPSGLWDFPHTIGDHFFEVQYNWAICDNGAAEASWAFEALTGLTSPASPSSVNATTTLPADFTAGSFVVNSLGSGAADWANITKDGSVFLMPVKLTSPTDIHYFEWVLARSFNSTTKVIEIATETDVSPSISGYTGRGWHSTVPKAWPKAGDTTYNVQLPKWHHASYSGPSWTKTTEYLGKPGNPSSGYGIKEERWVNHPATGQRVRLKGVWSIYEAEYHERLNQVPTTGLIPIADRYPMDHPTYPGLVYKTTRDASTVVTWNDKEDLMTQMMTLAYIEGLEDAAEFLPEWMACTFYTGRTGNANFDTPIADERDFDADPSAFNSVLPGWHGWDVTTRTGLAGPSEEPTQYRNVCLAVIDYFTLGPNRDPRRVKFGHTHYTASETQTYDQIDPGEVRAFDAVVRRGGRLCLQFRAVGATANPLQHGPNVVKCMLWGVQRWGYNVFFEGGDSRIDDTSTLDFPPYLGWPGATGVKQREVLIGTTAGGIPSSNANCRDFNIAKLLSQGG